jgi:hypothetical protein
MRSIKESEFNYKGYNCIVIFQEMGFRCGYVEVPSNHIYYKGEESSIDIECYGGITYTGNHIPLWKEPSEYWWIGFDCMHYGDEVDLELLKKAFSDDPVVQTWINIRQNCHYTTPHSVIRTLEFCENECRNIVDQLIKIDEITKIGVKK